MPTLLWDASALVKQYAPEVGSPTVKALFAARASLQMVATFWGYVETYASLVRKRNDRTITAATFRLGTTLLQSEVVQSPSFHLLAVDTMDLLGSIRYIQQHSLNAADGAILATYLRHVRALPPGSPAAVLVAADTRLLRGATAEGLATLNPETVAAADVPAFLAAL